MFHQHKVSSFKYKLCKKALAQVFNTVDFKDSQFKEILHFSYLANLNAMIQYAQDNNIDELAYILSLRDMFGGNVYKYER